MTNGPEATTSRPNRGAVPALAFGLGAALIAAYQTGILPFFSPLFEGAPRLWSVVHYGLWAAAAAVALVVLAGDIEIRRRMTPVIIAGLVTLAFCAIHPFDVMNRNLVLAVLLLVSLSTLLAAGGARQMIWLSAAATAFAAVVCLLDIASPYGLTNTFGRAAGLSINPNIAASNLLLGALATYRCLSPKIRTPFLLLVGTAILATLSRSTVLVGIGILSLAILASFIDGSWRQRRRPNGPSIAINVMVAMLLCGCLLIAAVTNGRFVLAARQSVAGVVTAQAALQAADPTPGGEGKALPATVKPPPTPAQAPRPVAPAPAGATGTVAAPPGPPPRVAQPAAEAGRAAALPAADTAPAAVRTTPSSTAAFPPPVANDAATGSHRDTVGDRLATLGKAAADQGSINSLAARGLLLQRSWVALQAGPLLGRGLNAAFELAPHNTYLMLAVAFGIPGLLVPLVLLVPAFYRARSLADLELGIALAGVMLFSHNTLVTPDQFLPFVVGAGAMLSRGLERRSPPQARPIVLGIAAASLAVVAAGCAGIARNDVGRIELPLDAEQINPAGGFAYSSVLLLPYAGLVQPTAPGTQGSHFEIREDGVPISRPPATLAEISTRGEGRAAQAPRDIVTFSTSDNSDPRSNGRSYAAVVDAVLDPLLLLLLGATLLWCILLAAIGRRLPR